MNRPEETPFIFSFPILPEHPEETIEPITDAAALVHEVSSSALQEQGADYSLFDIGERTIIPELQTPWTLSWLEWGYQALSSGIGQVATFMQPAVDTTRSVMARGMQKAGQAVVTHAVMPLVNKGKKALVEYVETNKKTLIDYVQSDPFKEKITESITSHMVPSGFYHSKIQHQRSSLDQKMGTTSGSESCKAFAKYAGDYLDHYLVHTTEIDAKFKSPYLEGLISHDTTDASKVHHSFVGEIVKATFIQNRPLLEETVEINMLNVMNNLVDALKDKLEKDPYFFLNLVSDVMEETAKEIDAMSQSKQMEHHQDSTIEDAFLYRNLSKALMALCFPAGASSIEIPIDNTVMLSYLKPKIQAGLYEIIQTTVFPRLIEAGFNELGKEKTREKLLIRGFTLTRRLFTKGSLSVGTKHLRYPEKRAMNNPKQEQFNKNLKKVAFAFARFVDPQSYRLLKILHLGPVIEKRGVHVATKLFQYDPLLVFGDALEKDISALVPDGKWTVEDGKKVFTYETPHFVKTEADVAAQKAKKLEKLADQESLDDLVKNFADDMEGFTDKVVKLPITRKKFLHNLRKFITTVIYKVKRKLAKIFIHHVGRKMVRKKGKIAEEKIKELPLPNMVDSFKQFVAKKVRVPKR